MLLGVVRRAAEARALLDLGALVSASVPLRTGGVLPAELFGRIAFNDLARLSSLYSCTDDYVEGVAWERLVEDIELLHAIALVRGSARQGAGDIGGIDEWYE